MDVWESKRKKGAMAPFLFRCLAPTVDALSREFLTRQEGAILDVNCEDDDQVPSTFLARNHPLY